MKTQHTPVPTTLSFERLRQVIIDEYADYSKGFKSVARVIIDAPHQVALCNITDLSNQAKVSAATLLRFITGLGYSGYADFQQLFKNNLVSQFHDYQQTLVASSSNSNDPYGLLQEIHELTNKDMTTLLKEVDSQHLMKIAKQIHTAGRVYLCAFRRLYPVSVHFYYTLSHLGRQVALIDGHAGLHEEQARQIGKRDALIIMSAHPYASEVQEVAKIAQQKGASLIAITDSELSPLCKLTEQIIIIKDIRVRNIRLPITTLNLIQSLCLSLVYLEESDQTT